MQFWFNTDIEVWLFFERPFPAASLFDSGVFYPRYCMKNTLKVESRVFRLSNILHYHVYALLTWGHSTLRIDSLKQQNFRLKLKYIVFPDNDWNNNRTEWKCIFATTQGAQPINNKQLEQQIPIFPQSERLPQGLRSWRTRWRRRTPWPAPACAGWCASAPRHAPRPPAGSWRDRPGPCSGPSSSGPWSPPGSHNTSLSGDITLKETCSRFRKQVTTSMQSREYWLGQTVGSKPQTKMSPFLLMINCWAHTMRGLDSWH